LHILRSKPTQKRKFNPYFIQNCGRSDLLAGRTKSPVTEALWKMRSAATSEQQQDVCQLGSDVASKFTRVTRKPSFSAVSIQLPFADDQELAFRYTNAFGLIRMGVILEDLDALAGNIAAQHSDNGENLLLVTASVDRIRILAPLHVDENYELFGQVVWVGSSSMVIRMGLFQTGQDKNEPPILKSNFTFVARDRQTMRAAKINFLEPETDEEKKWFESAAADNARKKAARDELKDPVAGGAALLRREKEVAAMIDAARPFVHLPCLQPDDAVFMNVTSLTNTLLTQPQHQNTAGRVFGGFLMRRAFEIAFSTACIFSGGRKVKLSAVSEVSFKRPVNVGVLLQFQSVVAHTEIAEAPGAQDPVSLCHVHVGAFITSPAARTSTLRSASSSFLFIYLSIFVRRLLFANTSVKLLPLLTPLHPSHPALFFVSSGPWAATSSCSHFPSLVHFGTFCPALSRRLVSS
jgi:acyl-coenzyme A thioesterase 9